MNVFNNGISEEKDINFALAIVVEEGNYLSTLYKETIQLFLLYLLKKSLPLLLIVEK